MTIAAPLLAVSTLSVSYPGGSAAGRLLRRVPVLHGIGFEVARGETLGIAGESGSGKSTLARALLGLTAADAGSVRFNGQELLGLDDRRMRSVRSKLQVIFQDPLAALNPRMTVAELIGEPLREFAPGLGDAARRERVLAMMQRVGLSAAQLDRYPHEFSGGQAQRIGIARALILEPALVVCDEPVSALDVSIKAQIINLLKDLQHDLKVGLIFISHDLAVMRALCDRVLVLYLGRLMELAPRDALYSAPVHPYTRALLASVPIADPVVARSRHRLPLDGEPPSPLNPPSGCVFRTRCPLADARCAAEVPAPRIVGESLVACHHAD